MKAYVLEFDYNGTNAEFIDEYYNNSIFKYYFPYHFVVKDGKAVSVQPFKFLTTKGEIFHIAGFGRQDEKDKIQTIRNCFDNAEIRVVCRDATLDEIKDLQDKVHLRDGEL